MFISSIYLVSFIYDYCLINSDQLDNTDFKIIRSKFWDMLNRSREIYVHSLILVPSYRATCGFNRDSVNMFNRRLRKHVQQDAALSTNETCGSESTKQRNCRKNGTDQFFHSSTIFPISLGKTKIKRKIA